MLAHFKPKIFNTMNTHLLYTLYKFKQVALLIPRHDFKIKLQKKYLIITSKNVLVGLYILVFSVPEILQCNWNPSTANTTLKDERVNKQWELPGENLFKREVFKLFLFLKNIRAYYAYM